MTLQKAQHLQTPHVLLMGLLFISHFLVIALGVAFTIYMIIDCALRVFPKDSDKIFWIIVICVLNFLGAIIYFYMYGKKDRVKKAENIQYDNTANN